MDTQDIARRGFRAYRNNSRAVQPGFFSTLAAMMMAVAALAPPGVAANPGVGETTAGVAPPAGSVGPSASGVASAGDSGSPAQSGQAQSGQAQSADAAPANGGLLPAELPAQFDVAAPAPLDALFSLVHSVVFDQPPAGDPRWADLYREVRKRDQAYYAAPPAAALPDTDPRRPVFPEGAGAYTADQQERLMKWAVAYRAGLPDLLEFRVHYSKDNLREDAEGRHYVFSPLEYQASALDDHAEVLDALRVPREQVAMWQGGGPVMMIIATNRLDLYEMPVAKADLQHVNLHTHALFRTGPVETLIDARGRHILLLPVQPIGLVLHDNEQTAAKRSFEDVPSNDGNTVPVGGPPPAYMRSVLL